ncbi:MAG: GNAT family N-acetyltransferase [Rhodoferax sp.]|nr:GNAT family N-acetyltransferase [Rhodoferax sp.]MCF8209768.1 GNAT family N-acetyltransferase [Rhodoferax sp.]
MSLPPLPPSLTTAPLSRHRALVPVVAQWFVAEWPAWYGVGGPGNIADDLNQFAQSEHQLPLGLVAFENEVPVGAAALKSESIPSHAHLGPWAAAGYVLPQCRGRGIGAVLLHGLVVKARELGYAHIYCGTSTSESLLVRAGWQWLEHTSMQGKPLAIFRAST